MTSANRLREADTLTIFFHFQPSTSTTSSSSDPAAERRQLICSSCKAIVGVTDPRAEGWRIWKWSIAATPKGEPTAANARSYSIRKWIAAQLLYLIENQAVRKFTVMVDSDDVPSEESGDPVQAAARDPIMVRQRIVFLFFLTSFLSFRSENDAFFFSFFWSLLISGRFGSSPPISPSLHPSPLHHRPPLTTTAAATKTPTAP